MTRRALVALVLAAAAAFSTAAAVFAGDNREQIRFNPADQAAARAATLRLADLGSSGWTGGRVKPDLTPAPTCADYHPKQSDLVLTGAARSQYRQGAVTFDSEVQVLQTARMVALDWRRSVLPAGAVSCLRRKLAASLGPNAKLVSYTRVAFPQVASYAAAFRAVIDVTAQGQTLRLLVDVVLVGRRRSEITLSVGGPASGRSALTAAERRLARMLVSRARA